MIKKKHWPEYSGLIYKLAYKRNRLYKEDDIQNGFEAAIIAMKKYDPSRGIKATTYLYQRVWGKMIWNEMPFHCNETEMHDDYYGGQDNNKPDLYFLLETIRKVLNKEINDGRQQIAKDLRFNVLVDKVLLGFTNKEIGEKHNLSPQRIDQINKKSFEMLRKAL